MCFVIFIYPFQSQSKNFPVRSQMSRCRAAPPTNEFTNIQTHMLTLRLSFHYNTLCKTIPREVFLGCWLQEMHCLWFYSSKIQNPPYNLGSFALRHLPRLVPQGMGNVVGKPKVEKLNCTWPPLNVLLKSYSILRCYSLCHVCFVARHNEMVLW